MAHHQSIEEAKPFKFTGNYTKTFGGMIVIGLLLLFGGYGLNKMGGGSDHGHGDGHGTEQHDDHGGASHDEHHSDAGKVMQFTDHHEEHADEGHHEEASHGGGHHMEPDHKENGTWRRAYVHEVQTLLEYDGRMVHNGAHHEVTTSSHFGASLLGGAFWWMCVALFGVFFIAVGYMANAGWYIVVKRIIEPFYRFIPIAIMVMLAVFFIFGENIWDWRYYFQNEYASDGQKVLFDTLLDGKAPFLSVTFIIATGIFIAGIWTVFGHLLRRNSIAEEKNGGLGYHKSSIRFSAMFLPIFALGFSFFCFLWIMSVDPHWFSTIYAVYCFAGLFVSGASITTLIAMHLNEKGFLPQLHSDHTHDLGKFIFAFSVFWAYIWVSQFLLIWYANIPEETVYYVDRFENYNFLFAANTVINFFFPFLALMTRDSKRKHLSLRAAIRVLLFGRFLDIFLLIAPGVLGAEWAFGDLVMFAGSFTMMGGVFLFIVFRAYEEAALVPKNHPYYEESLHHSTGV